MVRAEFSLGLQEARGLLSALADKVNAPRGSHPTLPCPEAGVRGQFQRGFVNSASEALTVRCPPSLPPPQGRQCGRGNSGFARQVSVQSPCPLCGHGRLPFPLWASVSPLRLKFIPGGLSRVNEERQQAGGCRQRAPGRGCPSRVGGAQSGTCGAGASCRRAMKIS